MAGIREKQAPLKDAYRQAPESALITLSARASEGGDAMACSIEVGAKIQEAQAHAGVGGAGTAACSGDLLLGALAACAQLTCQMVAASSGISVERVDVVVEGDLDLRGTLGVSRDAPVGFSAIRARFEIDAPGASERQLAMLRRLTEQYCVVLQTLTAPPPIESVWALS